ncbi:MAG: hypothetical protein IPM18_03325 [Phycisphaerales bacterium]|nr:hypothetical protein [Phycisphaerales bacterium]
MPFTAITRAHLDMAGGVRQLLLAGGAYLALVIVFASFAYRIAEPGEYAEVHRTCLFIIGIVQVVFVLFGFTDAIRRALQRDRTNGMLESHRLTPLSGLQLALGYLTGPPLVPAVLFLVGTGAGCYFALWYGEALGFPQVVIAGWLLAQAALLVLALFINAFVLLICAASGRVPILTVIVIAGLLGGWMLIRVVPGLALISGVLSGAWVLDLMAGRAGSGDVGALTVPGGLQIAFAAVFLLAAGHKLRYPHRPTFPLLLGLTLAGLAALTLVLGHHSMSGVMSVFGPGDEDIAAWRWLGTAITFLLILQLALLTAAHERAEAIRAGLFRAQVPPLRPALLDLIPWLLAVLGAVVLIAALLIEADLRIDGSLFRTHGARLVRITACVGIALWTDYMGLLWFALLRLHPLWAFGLTWLGLKLMPVLAQVAVLAIATLTTQPVKFVWEVATLSPLGTLAALYYSEAQAPRAGLMVAADIGLLVQAGVAIILTGMVLHSWSRRRVRAAMLARPAPAESLAAD